MIEKVEEWCRERVLLQESDKVVVACSGGSDSLALADILLKLRERYHLTLLVAHVEHGIRGEASRADAAFVRDFCQRRALDHTEKSVDVPAYAKRHSLSLEDAARRVRYQFLHEVAERMGGAKIATGHHRDDQAETVLMHLLRGAGSGGIGGIQPYSCGIIRPLLSVSRAEIETYCEKMCLKPRIDETNLVPAYLRNKVRLELLPALAREYNPALKEALCRTAELVGAEHEFIKEYAKKSLGDCAERTATEFIFQRNFLRELPLAIKREILRVAVGEMRGHLKEIGFSHIERMIDFVQGGKSGTFMELPGGLTLQCMYGAMHLTYAKDVDIARQRFETQELEVPGMTKLANLGLRVEAKFVDATSKPIGKNQIICDFAQLRFPVLVRTRREGDRFQPSGMQGSKKLKDFFIDKKIKREERDGILLFCDQKEIFWVGNMRQNQNTRCSEITEKFLAFTILEDEKE